MSTATPPILMLQAHPATPAGFVRRVGAAISRVDGGRTLYLDYAVDADLRQLRLPGPSAPARTDGLWRHTCFETFLRAPGATRYLELNFSPSGAWASYCFDDYRLGGRPAATGAPARSVSEADDTRFNLQLAIDLTPCPELATCPTLEAGMAAVLEERDGTLSYWALAHSAERPDFHRAEDWPLRLRVTGHQEAAQ